MKTWLNDRNIPLVFCRPLSGLNGREVLTIENYCKWYTLWIIRLDGTTEALSYEKLPDEWPGKLRAGLAESKYCDHVPNPMAVMQYAETNNLYLDPQAFEMIIGRWELEYKNRYCEETP